MDNKTIPQACQRFNRLYRKRFDFETSFFRYFYNGLIMLCQTSPPCVESESPSSS